MMMKKCFRPISNFLKHSHGLGECTCQIFLKSVQQFRRRSRTDRQTDFYIYNIDTWASLSVAISFLWWVSLATSASITFSYFHRSSSSLFSAIAFCRARAVSTPRTPLTINYIYNDKYLVKKCISDCTIADTFLKSFSNFQKWFLGQKKYFEKFDEKYEILLKKKIKKIIFRLISIFFF